MHSVKINENIQKSQNNEFGFEDAKNCPNFDIFETEHFLAEIINKLDCDTEILETTSSSRKCENNLEVSNVESLLSNENEVENIQNKSNLEVCDFCGNENEKTKDDIRKNLTIVKVCQIDYFQNEKVEGGLISEGIFTEFPS